MKINNKLKKISELVDANSFLLDVGCDHALLDIYLTKKNVKSLACDINDLPLKKALVNIKKYNVEDKITLKKGDGLEYLTSDVDTIVISGMGGILIKNIIKKDIKKITNQKVIVCPNNDSFEIRKFMMLNGFKITSEHLVKDKYIYEIIVYQRGFEILSKQEILYGKYFIHDFLYNSYLTNKLNKLIEIKNNLPRKYILKNLELTKKIRGLKKII